MLTDEIATKLAALGVISSSYVVMRGTMPETPDAVVGIFETGGFAPERFLGSSATVDQPGVMIQVRGAPDLYDGPRLQVEKIYQALIGLGGFTVSGVRYLGLLAQQTPFPVGKDANARQTFSVNFVAWKELSSTV